MNKKFFMSILAIIMVAVLSVGFTSCGDDDDEVNAEALLGVWRNTYDNGGYWQYTFHANNKFDAVETGYGQPYYMGGTYNVNGNKLTLTFSQGDGGTYTYTFKIKETELMLIDEDGDVEVFNRR